MLCEWQFASRNVSEGVELRNKSSLHWAKGFISWKPEDKQKKSLGSGVYFLRIKADSHIGTEKLLLIK